MSSDRIEKEIEIKAPVSRVWKALTDHTEFSTWFHVNLEGPFVPGETTRGKITHPGFEHVVIEVIVKSSSRSTTSLLPGIPTRSIPTRTIRKRRRRSLSSR